MEQNQHRKTNKFAVLNLKVLKIAVFCISAVFMNILLNIFVMNFLRFPLFLDTVFNAAITFAFGLIPGIIVAVLSLLLPFIYFEYFHFFILCSIAEVLLIYALKPRAPVIPDFASRERIIASYTLVAAKLILLYIICAVSISILGGIIDFLPQFLIDTHSHYFSVEYTFKLGLIMNNLPTLAVNILSRIPILLVDRFIVIFGGYFISRLILLGMKSEHFNQQKKYL